MLNEYCNHPYVTRFYHPDDIFAKRIITCRIAVRCEYCKEVLKKFE